MRIQLSSCLLNNLLDVLVCSITAYFYSLFHSLFLFLTRLYGLVKIQQTCKDTQRYYTPKRLVRYTYCSINSFQFLNGRVLNLCLQQSTIDEGDEETFPSITVTVSFLTESRYKYISVAVPSPSPWGNVTPRGGGEGTPTCRLELLAIQSTRFSAPAGWFKASRR